MIFLRMRWTESVTRKKKIRNGYKIVVRNLKRRDSFEDLGPYKNKP
jgi:hypothetical protein